MSSDSAKPIIFLSYAHLDEPEKPRGEEIQWLTFVMRFLRPAVKSGEFRIWVDRQMQGGTKWDKEIEGHLLACNMFVLLVSANSMGSDYIIDKSLRSLAGDRRRASCISTHCSLNRRRRPVSTESATSICAHATPSRFRAIRSAIAISTCPTPPTRSPTIAKTIAEQKGAAAAMSELLTLPLPAWRHRAAQGPDRVRREDRTDRAHGRERASASSVSISLACRKPATSAWLGATPS